MKKLFVLCFLLVSLPIMAIFEDHVYKIDGLSYYLDETNMTASVVEQTISGDVVIPESVSYENKTYSVIEIFGHDFFGSENLISIVIPNTIKEIGNMTFTNCRKLEKVTIPESVTSIGLGAFSGCSSLADVYCLGEKAPNCSIEYPTFEENDVKNAIIHVKDYAIETFKYQQPWIYFKEIVCDEKVTDFNLSYYVDGELYKIVQYKYDDEIIPEPAPTKEGYTFSGWSETPQRMPGKDVTISGYFTKDQPAEKCAAPTIEYNNGKLIINSETEGAECITSITSEDFNTHNGNEIDITATYNISTYAKAEGYENSDVVTATLCWIEVEEIETHINEQIKAKAILIRSHEGTLWITGPEEGTLIEVYNVTGQKIVSVYATTGTTMIETGLNVDDVALVKIKNKTVKVVMR